MENNIDNNITTTIKYLKITNNNNIPINKTFTLDQDGNIKKESNAIVYNAIFEEVEKTNLKDFDYDLKALQPNQCICLGASTDKLNAGYITTKGKENLQIGMISRSNEYTSTRSIQGIMLDLDPDNQMPVHLLSINTPNEFHKTMIRLLGDSYSNCSSRYGYGSSFGISKKDQNEPSSSSWSMHGYAIFKNFTNESADFLCEYFKRKAIKEDLWFFKIHKDGSTSFRVIIDLSVIKSLNSRLSFEAPASIGEGLEQVIPESTFYNCDNGIVPFDINSLSLTSLPDWKPYYEKEKIKQKNKIFTIKEKYRENAIDELIKRNNYDPVFARNIINHFLDTRQISASMCMQASDGNLFPIYYYLIQKDVQCWEVFDFIDPQKGLGKSRIYVNDIFDSRFTTYLRGGNSYKISFTKNEIEYVLNNISFERDNINKIMYCLIDYLNENGFSEKDVKDIIRIIDIKLPQFQFGKKYYYKNIDNEVKKRMKDHAFLMYSGKAGYIDLTQENLELYKRTDLIEKYRNKNFDSTNPEDVDGKKIKIKTFDKWSESDYRKEYYNIAFTDKEVDKETYNLFKGFPYQPIDHEDVDIEIFFTFVYEVICDKDGFIYNIVIAFIAQIMQDPFNKLGTSIVISGKKRIGKGSFVKTITELVGTTLSMQTSNKDDVFTRFNAHLMYKILIYFNEAYWHGDKKIESSMKSLMTDDDTTYEIKNGPTFSGKNYSRLILDSNDALVVPATFDEGRYIALKASDCRKDDKEFFDKVNTLRENTQAMEKLMYYFVNFDYKPYEKYLREAPKTKFLGEQISRNFGLIDQWWNSNLTRGDIFGVEYVPDGDGIRIANESLWQSFKSYHGDNKTKYLTEDNFFKDIKEKFLNDIIVKKDQKMHGTNKSAKVIASLLICREKFILKNHLGAFENDISQWDLSSSVMPRFNML